MYLGFAFLGFLCFSCQLVIFRSRRVCLGRGGVLQHLYPGGGVGVGLDLAFQTVETLILCGEALLKLVKKDSGLGIHGSATMLYAGIVIVGGRGNRVI
jgi:hypothetical protein